MAKTYNITVKDAEQIIRIDKAIAESKDPSVILNRGAYDYLYRKEHQKKNNELMKKARELQKSGKL
jgi:malate synthase